MDKPIRCFSCGCLLFWNRYERELEAHKQNRAEALNKMNVKRHCCRRMYLTSLTAAEQQIGLRQTLEDVKERVVSAAQKDEGTMTERKVYGSWFKT